MPLANRDRSMSGVFRGFCRHGAGVDPLLRSSRGSLRGVENRF